MDNRKKPLTLATLPNVSLQHIFSYLIDPKHETALIIQTNNEAKKPSALTTLRQVNKKWKHLSTPWKNALEQGKNIIKKDIKPDPAILGHNREKWPQFIGMHDILNTILEQNRDPEHIPLRIQLLTEFIKETPRWSAEHPLDLKSDQKRAYTITPNESLLAPHPHLANELSRLYQFYTSLYLFMRETQDIHLDFADEKIRITIMNQWQTSFKMHLAQEIITLNIASAYKTTMHTDIDKDATQLTNTAHTEINAKQFKVNQNYRKLLDTQRCSTMLCLLFIATVATYTSLSNDESGKKAAMGIFIPLSIITCCLACFCRIASWTSQANADRVTRFSEHLFSAKPITQDLKAQPLNQKTTERDHKADVPDQTYHELVDIKIDTIAPLTPR